MKKKTAPEGATYFKFKLNKVTLVLCILVLLLCAAGIATSVYRILQSGVHSLDDALKSPFLIAVCLFCTAIIVSILIKSQYIVDSENFTTQFGFIKSRLPVKDITSLELNTTTNKLTLYCGENFSVVSINKDWNDEFIRSLLKVNPDIQYSFTLTDNVPPSEEEK